MKRKAIRRYGLFGGLALLGGILLLSMGGCPVDTDKLTTEVVQAALESISTSIVDVLSTYLAGN